MNIRFYLKDKFILEVDSIDISLKNIYHVDFGHLNSGDLNEDKVWVFYDDASKDGTQYFHLLNNNGLELLAYSNTLADFSLADKVIIENKKEILVFEKGKSRVYRKKGLLYDLSFKLKGNKKNYD